jgi:DNA-binding NarL/FixJ family response regulator
MHRHGHLSILLVDTHDVMRRGLRSLLSRRPDWDVCGEAKNRHDAVDLTVKLQPDIVILDLENVDGIETARQIKRAHHETEILIYTVQDEEYRVAEAFRSGVRGYILKSDDEDSLIEAIEALANHLPFLGTNASEVLLQELKTHGGGEEPHSLTRREREIIQLLSDGHSNRKIASRLQISEKTVEAHRTAIMRKFRFKSITELVRYAIRSRLIQP